MSTVVNGFDCRSLQVGRGFKVLGTPLDIAAESLLSDGTSDAALEAAVARQIAALETARSVGEDSAIADAMRLVVRAHCLKAEHSSSDTVASNALLTAEDLVVPQVAAFRKTGAVQEMALMQLSQAEIYLQQGGFCACAASAALARKALKVLKSRGGAAAALAQLQLAAALVACVDQNAQEEADEAVKNFRALQDRKGEAYALHYAALARAVGPAGATRMAYEDAVRCALDALSAFRDLEHWQGQWSVQLSLARLNLERERPELAAQAAREAMVLIKEFGGSADAWRTASSMLARACMDDGDEDEALVIAREMVQHHKEKGDTRQQALALDTLAGLMAASGSREDSMAEVSTALELARKLQDIDLQARLLLRHSSLEVCQCNDNSALQAAEDAIALWESSEDDKTEEVACAQFFAVPILLRMFDPKDAMKEASKVRAFFAGAGDKYREAVTLVSIATVTYTSGQIDEALTTLQYARDLFREAADPRGEAMALTMVAEIKRNEGQLQEALEVMLQSRSIVQEAGWTWAEIQALCILTSLYRQLDDLKAAGRAAREGLRMARNVGQKDYLVQLLLQAVQCNLSLIAAGGGPTAASRNLLEETTRLARDAVNLTACSTGSLAAGGWRRQHRAQSLFWQAHVVSMQNHGDALSLLNQADEISKQTGDQQVQAHSMLLAAQIHLADGNKERAEALIRPALELMKEVGDEGGLDLAQQVLVKATGVKVGPSPGDVAQAEEATEAAPQSAVTDAPKKLDRQAVRAQLMDIAVNALASEDEVHDDTPLMDSGMDSLTSVSFRNEVEEAFKTKLPASLVFDYPSIGEITRYVMELAN